MRMVILAALTLLLAAPAHANPIRKACLSSPRDASRQLCTCIQAAANRTLSRRDQKIAAKFFIDPDRAEKMRMSDRPSHEKFWKRYKAFGAFAASACR